MLGLRPAEPGVTAAAIFASGGALPPAAHPDCASLATSDPASEIPFTAACVASEQRKHRPWAAFMAERYGTGMAHSRCDQPGGAAGSDAGTDSRALPGTSPPLELS